MCIYKSFYDENKKLMNLFGIGVDSQGIIDFKTYYLDNGSRIKQTLNNKSKILYIQAS